MSSIASPTSAAASDSRIDSLRTQFELVRRFSQEICAPLATEDYVIQSMPDASPTRWHLAHTTWFLETFLLKPYSPDYRSPNDQFEYLFNSYYNTVGRQFSRPHRGFLSRPTVAEVHAYRNQVDEHVGSLLSNVRCKPDTRLLDVLELGIHHEQQHQELMLTDIKHVFSCNPLFPVYLPPTAATKHPHAVGASAALPSSGEATGLRGRQDAAWIAGESGLVDMGDASDQFVFDNERPRHQVFLRPYRLGSRLVTNREFQEFMADDGYRRPELWLSLGWQTVQREGWEAPLYWYQIEGSWQHFTLRGLQPVGAEQPVCHVSYFEADAFARWRGCRLPQESEWEAIAVRHPVFGNFVESRRFHPQAATDGESQLQMFGDVWEWTASPYVPYPGYAPASGALGEYNGKFMCNQYVLRGGSCASPQSHLRATYRNFFPPDARWQFTGIRLAADDD